MTRRGIKPPGRPALQGLSPAARGFVLHWGEIGAQWGVSRTVAEIHALLLISPKPLCAQDITDTLSVARSNVSNGLRALRSCGIVHGLHVPGDRREHFESLRDVRETFLTILNERRKRALDPTLAVLGDLVALAKRGGPRDAFTQQRLHDVLQFVEYMITAYEQFYRSPLNSREHAAKSDHVVVTSSQSAQ